LEAGALCAPLRTERSKALFIIYAQPAAGEKEQKEKPKNFKVICQ